MDYNKQKHLKFLDFIGIFKESMNIIFSNPKLFTMIFFGYILPYTIFTLFNIEVFKYFSKRILEDPSILKKEHNLPLWILLNVIIVTYFMYKYLLLSASSVVYTAACTYTDTEITFKDIVSFAKTVRNKLLITMLSTSFLVYVYAFVVAVCVMLLSNFGVIFYFSSKQSNDITKISTLPISAMVVLLLVGVIVMSIFWQLAKAITVLDDYYGFKALKKSRQLIKGNIGNAIAILIVQSFISTPIFVLAQHLFGFDYIDSEIGLAPKIVYGIIYAVLNSLILLYGLVVQTVFYFVCKAYHNESIDMSLLMDELDASKSNEDKLHAPKSNVDYAPLKRDSVENV